MWQVQRIYADLYAACILKEKSMHFCWLHSTAGARVTIDRTVTHTISRAKKKNLPVDSR